MATTNELVTQQFGSLRNKLSELSFGLNRGVIIEGGELNELRRIAGAALTTLNSVEVLVTQTKHEQATVRKELDSIGTQIHMLVNQMNPQFLAGRISKTDEFDPHPMKGEDSYVNEPDSPKY